MTRVIYTDGGTKGNQVCIVDENKKTAYLRRLVSNMDLNGTVEFEGLIFALDYIEKCNDSKFLIKSDASTVVRAVVRDKHEWRKKRKKGGVFEECMEKLEELEKKKDIHIVWVRREANLAGRVLSKLPYENKREFKISIHTCKYCDYLFIDPDDRDAHLYNQHIQVR